MEPKQGKTGKINIIICRDLKKVMGNRVKIFRISCNQSKLDKVKVKEMKDKKG